MTSRYDKICHVNHLNLLKSFMEWLHILEAGGFPCLTHVMFWQLKTVIKVEMKRWRVWHTAIIKFSPILSSIHGTWEVHPAPHFNHVLCQQHSVTNIVSFIFKSFHHSYPPPFYRIIPITHSFQRKHPLQRIVCTKPILTFAFFHPMDFPLFEWHFKTKSQRCRWTQPNSAYIFRIISKLQQTVTSTD